MGVASNQVGCARRSYRRNTWHLNEAASLRPSRSKFAQSYPYLSAKYPPSRDRRSPKLRSINHGRCSRTRSSLGPYRKGTSRNSEEVSSLVVPCSNRDEEIFSCTRRKRAEGEGPSYRQGSRDETAREGRENGRGAYRSNQV